MKKILYLIVIITIMGQVSCGEFLKESSGDLLIPKKVQDYAALLNGEGYPKKFPSTTEWINLMTDDYDMAHIKGFDESEGIDNLAVDGFFAYRWDIDIEEKMPDGVWDMCYEYILGCNTIIQALPVMVYDENETDMYNSLAASAYALRAYYYFCLVNWYAEPYSTENLSKLGVIIKLAPNVTLGQFERNTIGEVYKLINDDIAIARDYSRKGRPTANKFLVSNEAIEFLANRIALFQEKWDEVITDGEAFLKTNGKLFDLKSSDKTKFGLDDESFTMLHYNNNPEILFSFGDAQSSPYGYLCTSPIWKLGFTVNKEGDNALIPLYKEGDLRLQAYYKVDWVDKDGNDNFENNYPIKYINTTSNVGYMINWRNVEVYLNVAEAYARRDNGISTNAIELLNTIRQNRFDVGYVPLTTADFSSKESLVEFVWEERRRELSFEETMRWWDIRRQGCKQITHRYYINFDAFETYIIPTKCPNFVIQIPISEYGINDVITTNKRVKIDKL